MLQRQVEESESATEQQSRDQKTSPETPRPFFNTFLMQNVVDVIRFDMTVKSESMAGHIQP